MNPGKTQIVRNLLPPEEVSRVKFCKTGILNENGGVFDTVYRQRSRFSCFGNKIICDIWHQQILDNCTNSHCIHMKSYYSVQGERLGLWAHFSLGMKTARPLLLLLSVT